MENIKLYTSKEVKEIKKQIDSAFSPYFSEEYYKMVKDIFNSDSFRIKTKTLKFEDITTHKCSYLFYLVKQTYGKGNTDSSWSVLTDNELNKILNYSKER